MPIKRKGHAGIKYHHCPERRVAGKVSDCITEKVTAFYAESQGEGIHNKYFLMGKIDAETFYIHMERLCLNKLSQLLLNHHSDHINTAVERAIKWTPWHSYVAKSVSCYHESLRDTDAGKEVTRIQERYVDIPQCTGDVSSRNHEDYTKRKNENKVFRKTFSALFEYDCSRDIAKNLEIHMDRFFMKVDDTLESLRHVGMEQGHSYSGQKSPQP